MNQLQIIEQNGPMLLDSREVAEMIGVRHSDLLEKIDGYVRHLLNGNFRSADFFYESTYQDSTGRTLKCYLLTRKGCDMIANKLIGEKGVQFTAAYVTKFEEMEQTLKPEIDVSQLSPELQMFNQTFQALAKMQLEQKQTQKQLAAVNEKVEVIQETFLKRDEDWRNSMNSLLNTAAYRLGGKYQDLRHDSYRILEERAHCNLNIRLCNLRERLIDSGATKTKVNNTTRLDVIEADPRLKEIYSAIVKELSIGSMRVM